MPSSDASKVLTFQTRPRIEENVDEILAACAHAFSQIERHLYADYSAGKEIKNLKSEYLKKYEITARHFNAIRVQLEGKIASGKELQTIHLSQIQDRIESVTKSIKKIKDKDKLHQKKRVLARLEKKKEKIKSDQIKGKISLCFGSSKLFRAQFNLEKNGYKNHEEWAADWEFARNNSFFLLGSKDETSGNQSCCATVNEKGNLDLRIRLPDSLTKIYGKYVVIQNLNFAYGHKQILAALEASERRKQLLKLKDPTAPTAGQAISYRFKKDAKGWRVFASISIPKKTSLTSSKEGVIGLDINATHIALSETDRFGNPIAKKTIFLNTYGNSPSQNKALIGEACKEIISLAKAKKKTVVIEDLDFTQKKAQLKEQGNPKHARMLSSLAYSNIKNNLNSKAWKEGVQVEQVNPAFTSCIGRVKFSKRYGLSVHHAAALVIGRRCLKFSERIPSYLGQIPDGKDGHVTLSLPARNRDKHVWSSWKILNAELKTVLAAHFRARNRSLSSKSTHETKHIPNFVGEIPTRESSTQRLGWRAYNISTSGNV